MYNATCDHCGPAVSALVTVRLPSGHELSFCGHHFTRHQHSLPSGTVVCDVDPNSTLELVEV